MLCAGTAFNYAKTQQMQQKVNQKMNEVSGKKKSPFSVAALDFSFVVGMKVSTIDNYGQVSGINTEEVDYRLSGIIVKLRSGKRLSSGDLEYLRKKDPSLYNKALEIEEERQEYENELRKCKTKEEVAHFNMVKTASYLAQIRKAEASNDLGAALEIEMRVNAIKDSHETFVASEAYRELPESYLEIDNERKQGEKAEEEAGKDTDNDADNDAEETDETKTDEVNGDSADDADTGEAGNAESADTETQTEITTDSRLKLTPEHTPSANAEPPAREAVQSEKKAAPRETGREGRAAPQRRGKTK